MGSRELSAVLLPSVATQGDGAAFGQARNHVLGPIALGFQMLGESSVSPGADQRRRNLGEHVGKCGERVSGLPKLNLW